MTIARGRGWRPVLVGVVAAALVMLPASAVLADPTADAEQRISAIEVELARHSAAREEADIAVQVAGERYTRALVALEAAQASADRALADAEQATEAMEQARSRLGTIAQQAYRDGASMDLMAVLLSADGVSDLVARTSAVRQLGAKAEEDLQRFEAAKLVAETMQQLADDAVAAAAAAAEEADDALADAEQAQADAESQVVDLASRRDAYIAELATLRQSSEQAERERQDALDAERQRLADEAARARVVQAAAQPPAPPAESPTPSEEPTPSPSPSAGPSPTPSGPSQSPSASPTPSTPPVTSDLLGTGTSRGGSGQGQAAVAWAMTQLGKEYVYGAAGPDSYDCSGFTMRAWEQAGVSLNRSSRDQYKQVLKITYDQLRPGDLVFYGSDQNNPDSVYHVAMWVGDGTLVEASQPGVPSRVTPMRWANAMPFAGRP